MTDNYTAIKARIVTDLNAITEIKYTYAYAKGLREGYPCALVYGASYSPRIQSTTSDDDVYTYNIQLVQEIKNEEVETAEINFDKALTKVVQAFQTDNTLNNLANYTLITAVTAWQNGEIPCRVADIKLEVHCSEAII